MTGNIIEGVLCIVFVLIVMCVHLGVLIHRRKRIEQQKNAIKSSMHQENDYYRSLVYINRDFMHIKHDLNRQKRFENQMKSREQISSYSGHKVVDVILTQKVSDALSAGQTLLVNADDMSGLQLPRWEVVSLLANLLDNAREACERCEGIGESDTYGTEIIMKREDTALHINVRNDKPENEHLNVHDMKTNKSDKENHGYGVEIIKGIVDRHAGYMSMIDSGKWFSTDIIIPGIFK